MKFTWNVHARVGPRCPNRVDDVQLVQFGYHCMARDSSSLTGLKPEEIAILSTIVPGASYSGSPQDPLTLAIKAHQRLRGGAQDGNVSPIKNNEGVYGSHAWMIISLCISMMNVYPAFYPLVHKAPKCPAAFAAVVKRTFSPNYY